MWGHAGSVLRLGYSYSGYVLWVDLSTLFIQQAWNVLLKVPDGKKDEEKSATCPISLAFYFRGIHRARP